jgi:hypothetical protein
MSRVTDAGTRSSGARYADGLPADATGVTAWGPLTTATASPVEVTGIDRAVRRSMAARAAAKTGGAVSLAVVLLGTARVVTQGKQSLRVRSGVDTAVSRP